MNTTTTGKPISTYEIRDGRIYLHTPYAEKIVNTCRAWGGKFKDGSWVLPLSRLDSIREFIGWDQTDLVEAEAAYADEAVTSHGSAVLCGWHVLASRRSRDQRADIHADLVAGSVPPSGGSMKYPCVNPSNDAAFRFWVSRDFAESRELKIVTDPRLSLVADVSEVTKDTPMSDDTITETFITSADAAILAILGANVVYAWVRIADNAHALIQLVKDDAAEAIRRHRDRIDGQVRAIKRTQADGWSSVYIDIL